ncbi:1258_t:CDS:2 [Funneliformis caledonium]|uniref:1258_t:CDS:1 n=1 Tax=Funneliformis caledonium TaxID=1117310 RepID=A0A9N8YWE3_9GLOM|nr:1258_t:CDS:2 [Funneliformis caledonium]
MTAFFDSFTVFLYEKNNTYDGEVVFNDLKIGHIKFLICREKDIKINNYNDLNLWKADFSYGYNLKDLTEEQICKDSEQLVPIIYFKEYFLDQDAVDKIKDAVDIALKGSNKNTDIIRPDNKMPFMERNTDQVILEIMKNIQNHLQGSKAKTDFNILVSGRAPGIDFGNSCKLDSYDDELTPTVIIGLRIAYVFFIEGKYTMNIYNLQLNRHIIVFIHIDEFQLINQWEFNAVNKRKVLAKELFKEMINGLASYMLGPPSLIYVQTFLSGTAPQVVIAAKESSKVSFRFANCPQLLFRAMLNIANHYAQKYGAEKFDCERYNIYGTIEKNKKLALELLYHSIDAIPVKCKTCLNPSDEDYTIKNLERDAHIILSPCNDTFSEFTIKMPFFFVCLYNDKLKIVDFSFEETFRMQNTMHWQDWELFVTLYETFRTNLLMERGKRTVHLELYRGVFGAVSAKNIEEEGEVVVVNGASAEWGDSFRVLQTVQGDRLFSIHQAKYDYNSATYTLKDLLKEHIKNYVTSINTKKELFDKLANNFEQYFGPVFSFRATFALTKNINPNFSESQRMVKCLSGVGDVTAEEIIINRPYKSEDDFFKNHGQAKRGIEKNEHENPKKKIKLDFYPFNVQKIS